MSNLQQQAVETLAKWLVAQSTKIVERDAQSRYPLYTVPHTEAETLEAAEHTLECARQYFRYRSARTGDSHYLAAWNQPERPALMFYVPRFLAYPKSFADLTRI